MKIPLKTMITITFLLLLITSMIMAPLAYAISTQSPTPYNHDEHEDEDNHEKVKIKDPEEDKKPELEEHEDSIVIKSDDNKIIFKTDKPKLRFEYYTENGTEVEFEVMFYKIYEFVDENSNGRVDSGEKQFAQDLEDFEWRINLTTYSDAETNNTWYQITYSYTSETLNITLVMYVFQKATEYADGGADEVKIDIYISKSDWKSEDSLLAICAKMELEVEDNISEISPPFSAEEGIYLETITGQFIKYEWTKTIQVDGNESTIISSYYKKMELEYEAEEEESL